MENELSKPKLPKLSSSRSSDVSPAAVQGVDTDTAPTDSADCFTPPRRDAQDYRQPFPRSDHCAAAIEGGKVMIWGGRTKSKKLSSVVEVFDVASRRWEQWRTTGPPPPGLEAAACASVGEYFYVYGGITDHDLVTASGMLHRLNTKTLQWTVMSPQNVATDSPMAKSYCRMAAIGDQLALLGGISSEDHHFMDSAFDDDRMTNEFHLYDIKEDKWISPVTTGERPPPCAGCSLTSIDHRRVVMFGGNTEMNENLDDVYIIDVEIMHWTKIIKPESGLWPVERSDHVACCLNYGQEHPRVLVTGGLNNVAVTYGEIPGDDMSEQLEYIWILHVDDGSWIKASDTPVGPGRYRSSATAVNLSGGVTEVVIFGGSFKCSDVDNTTILSFGVHSLFQLCVDHILNSYSLYEPLLQQFLPHHIQTHIHQEREKNGLFYFTRKTLSY